MKALISVVVYALVISVCLAAESPRVRPVDPVAAQAFERGQHHSTTFRALVDELGQSDLIVHVVTNPTLPYGIRGATRFVATLGGVRYVRVDISSALSEKARTSVLAHELRHACEIARSTARSPAEVAALYRDIGETIATGFETDAADAAGRMVWSELNAWRRRRRTEQ
jgi:hypothetical protein